MNKGQFKKGSVPFNKGKKLEDYIKPDTIEKIKETQFKPGQTAGEKSHNWKGGVQEMKGDCVHIYDGVNKRKRRPIAVYEAEFGPIPKGHVIYHLDGDKNNDDPYNLEAITRAEMLRRNRFKE